MKLDIEVDSDQGDAFVIEWLKNYRDTCIQGAARPLDTEDYMRTVNAIDAILRTMMSQEDWDAYASEF